MKPATPLTCAYDEMTNSGAQHVIYCNDEPRKLRSLIAIVKPDACIADVHGTSREYALYLTHAANAYPRLVAALQELLDVAEPFGEVTPADPFDKPNVRNARALLRELGEL